MDTFFCKAMFVKLADSVVKLRRLASQISAQQAESNENRAYAQAMKASAYSPPTPKSKTQSRLPLRRSWSRHALRHSRITVGAINITHLTSGEYVYCAELSCVYARCDDQSDGDRMVERGDRMVEHKWTTRFTMGELNHVFSKRHKLGNKIKSVVDDIIGPRPRARPGTPTVLIAMRDRFVRYASRTLQVSACLSAVLLFSLALQHAAVWLQGVFRGKAFAEDIDPSIRDLVVGSSVPNLAVGMAAALVICVGGYWLFDVFVVRMLPSKMHLRYQYSNVEDVRNCLNELVSDKSRLRSDHAVAALLHYSAQALRHRLPPVVHEGFVYCRFRDRQDGSDFGYSDDNGRSRKSRALCEMFCCRFSCELGTKAHTSKWHHRWAVLRPSGVTFFRAPGDKSPTHVLLFDNQFHTVRGWTTSPKYGDPRSVPKLTVEGSNKLAELALVTDHDATSWFHSVNYAASPARSVWTREHRFGSFLPKRPTLDAEAKGSNRARWFFNGRGYYAALSEAIARAEREIFITGWFFTPTVLLTRAATGTDRESDESIADAIEGAAKRGVKIYILLYEEIPQALANNSGAAKKSLEALHTNIHVIRHRSRFSRNVYWSHHEKTVVCDQGVAFVGGIDLALMRYDDWRHRLDDVATRGTPGKTLWPTNDYQNIRVVDFHDVDKIHKDVIDRKRLPRQPWRDVACQIWGAGATDVGRHFIERWEHARSKVYGSNYYDVYPALELEAVEGEIKQKNAEDTNRSIPFAAQAVLEELKSDVSKVTYRNRPAPLQMTPENAQNLTSVQVLRSVGRWSCGARHENSIHTAYCSLIENSKRTLYIENQFFASGASSGDNVMGNRVAHALATRLVRAASTGETFRCVIVLPLLPGFANEIDDTSGKAGPLLTVMYYQYRTISKGPDSLLGQLQAAIDESVQKGILSRGACPQDYVQFFGLRNWADLGGRCVTEDVYVHSKAMVVDDETVIIGSANINDRSMLGNRDSEVCLCLTDESLKFGSSMRTAAMCEFFGEMGADGALSDWHKEDVWGKMREISRENTRLYRKALFPLPDDTISSWGKLREKQISRTFNASEYPPDQMFDGVGSECLATLRKINGIVVEFPLEFLSEEDLTPKALSAGGLAPSIFN